MTVPTLLRRATPLVAVLGVACDVLQFASDPKPTFEQTWNVPASSTSISVAQLLPSNVSIYSTPASSPPDSSAIQVSVSNVAFSKRLGDQCAACQASNGQTVTKPAFTIIGGGKSLLPPDLVSATLSGGSAAYSIVNAFSFDPLRIRAASDPTQGTLIITLRSGATVVGADTVSGVTTTWPSGATLNRTIPLHNATIADSMSVDLSLNSPQGDHNETINANGTVQLTASFPSVLVASATINVPNKSISNPPRELDLKSFGDKVQRATFEMNVTNPWSVSGTVTALFVAQPDQQSGPSVPDTVKKQLNIASGTTPASVQTSSITLTLADVQKLENKKVEVTLTGSLNAAAPVTVTPKQVINMDNRIIITVRTGGGQ